MDGDPNSLRTLEWHVKEFYSGNVNNEQILKIQKLLESFSCQKEAWRNSLYFLNQTTHDQTAMFFLNVLEGFITKGWCGLSNEEQLEIRNTLYHWILERHITSPYFVRNKAILLIIQIARCDWPDRYPDFYSNILTLVTSPSPSTAVIGLLFIQTASEELGTPRDNVLSSRKAELKQRLLQLVPQTLSVLTGLLESIWEKQSHSITSTPPPSPTNPTVNSVTQNSTAGGSSGSSLNSELDLVVQVALQCLTHLFSWIPLSSHVTPQLMELIFRYVGMGTQHSLPKISTSNELSVPVLAVGAINEMLYKNCVPVEFGDFVVLLFNNSAFVLHHLVQKSNDSRLPNPINPDFVAKFVELIHLLVSSHLRRLEGRTLPLFSVPQFLSLFYSFTFEQSDWTRYSSCLDTWQVFLDYVKESSETSNQDAPAQRYRECLVSLSESVLSKVLHFTNGAQLSQLDDEDADGDMETESKKMLRQSIEIFVTVGEILKNETLSQLNEPFQRCTSAYQTLVSLSAASNGVVRIESKSQLKELLVLLKDLASLLQLIGRLCELHIGANFPNHFEVGKLLVQKLLDLSSCGTSVASIKFIGCPDEELKSILSQVHAHCLSSLQAWCHWISLLVHSNASKEPAESLVFALVSSATTVFTPAWVKTPLGSEGSEQVYHASLQLLNSVICIIRSHFLWNCSTWNQLFVSVHEIQYLPPSIHRQLVRCVLGSAVVGWRNCSAEEQRWNERQTRLKTAIENVTKGTWLLLQQLLAKESNQLLVQGKAAFVATLTLLSELASVVHDESTTSKAVLHSAIRVWIEPTLALLSMDVLFMDDHEVTESIFNFYLSVFDCLLNQIGSDQAEKAVQTFLQTFNQFNIETVLRQENSHGARAIERLLRILQIVVQEPGASFKRFLPSTLALCLDHIYPCVAQLPSSDLKETLYHLLTLILRHHWRYFFKGPLLVSYGSPGSKAAETVENQSQFISIMTAYGQSFMLPDINIFQQNLAALDTLHSKWKLYHKSIFRAGIAKEFINTLFEVLSSGSHELLRDEIGLSIHAMASADFEVFFHQNLPSYLVTCQGIDDQQRMLLKNGFTNETDLPSFTRNVHRLTFDLRCYRSTNASNASLHRS